MREYDDDIFNDLCKFATGGVPAFLETGKLFDENMKKARSDARFSVKKIIEFTNQAGSGETVNGIIINYGTK